MSVSSLNVKRIRSSSKQGTYSAVARLFLVPYESVIEVRMSRKHPYLAISFTGTGNYFIVYYRQITAIYALEKDSFISYAITSLFLVAELRCLHTTTTTTAPHKFFFE